MNDCHLNKITKLEFFKNKILYIYIYIYIYIWFYIKELKINCFQISTWALCFLILPMIINWCLQRAFSTPLLLIVAILSFLINIHVFLLFIIFHHLWCCQRVLFVVDQAEVIPKSKHLIKMLNMGIIYG
jgi:hypothetical protein